jgi:predicted kinase
MTPDVRREMMKRPKCVIVSGRPGSGKTTLARKLAESLHMPMLSRDEGKEGFVTTFGVHHDRLPADTNRKMTNFFFETVQSFLEAQVSLVVEAAFQHKLWEEPLSRWLRVGQPVFIVCDADPTLCARRHLDRGLNDATREFYHGDKRVKVYRETGEFLGPGKYDPPSFDVPTLIVSTTAGYSPDVTTIRDFVVKEKDA